MDKEQERQTINLFKCKWITKFMFTKQYTNKNDYVNNISCSDLVSYREIKYYLKILYL